MRRLTFFALPVACTSSARSMGFMGSGKKKTVASTPRAAPTASTTTTTSATSSQFSGSGVQKAASAAAAAAAAATATATVATSAAPGKNILKKFVGDVKKTAQCAASVAAETTNTAPGKLPMGEKLDLRNPLSTVTTLDDGSKMHFERCVMGWQRDDIYSVVADVSSYSEFLPWCVKSQVHSCNENGDLAKATQMDATLHVGFSFFKEKYTSDVSLVPGSHIRARLQGDSTLLKELYCDWYFKPYVLDPAQHPKVHHPHATEVDFKVSFAFRNPLHTNMTSMVMSNVVSVMTKSFEERIEKMHGKPSVKKYYLAHNVGEKSSEKVVGTAGGSRVAETAEASRVL